MEQRTRGLKQKDIDLAYLQVLWIKSKSYNGLRLAKKACQPPVSSTDCCSVGTGFSFTSLLEG